MDLIVILSIISLPLNIILILSLLLVIKKYNKFVRLVKENLDVSIKM